jgi:hypothetical protein
VRGWSSAEIQDQCRRPYAQYERERRNRYRDYFARNPNLAGTNPICARDLRSALPPGDDRLLGLVDVGDLHRWHLSGKSSQTLALALLGSSMLADPSLGWLFATVEPMQPPPKAGEWPRSQLELTLDPELLGERPFPTALDFFAEADEWVLCIEAKWTEAGLGTCRCPAPELGECSDRILGRPAYWRAAKQFLGLPKRTEGRPCPIHVGYQAVRNAAAAAALAAGRRAIFGLIYDEDNPYFAGAGNWPGWPVILSAAVEEQADSAVNFASCSWQALVPQLPLRQPAMDWAREKHGLG